MCAGDHEDKWSLILLVIKKKYRKYHLQKLPSSLHETSPDNGDSLWLSMSGNPSSCSRASVVMYERQRLCWGHGEPAVSRQSHPDQPQKMKSIEDSPADDRTYWLSYLLLPQSSWWEMEVLIINLLFTDHFKKRNENKWQGRLLNWNLPIWKLLNCSKL